MPRKKRQTTENLETTVLENESSASIIFSTVEKDTDFKSLRTRLAEINQTKELMGYIVKNATSAAIDLKDPSSLVAFALLASHAADACKEFSEMFGLGEVEEALLEGQTAKVLCLAIDENAVSVFMEKTADHKKILKQILR